MTEERVTRLRQRMIEDMNIRGLAEKTQKVHIHNVKHFAAFLGRSPDTATPEELRSYQLKMTEDGVSASTVNVRIISLRFFFGVTCGREEMKRFMQFHRKPRKLPVALSVEEVADLLAAVPGPGLKYRAVLGISYGAGLRASDVCNLKVTDIDSDHMLIHVDDGKGGRDRKAMLSPNLLALLREHWRESRPEGWLFPGKPKINPLSPRQLKRAFTSAKHMAGIKKAATLHTLRHSVLVRSKPLERLTRQQNRSRRFSPRHTFPIARSRPPRLPPSEVCQRGPPPPSRHRRAAAPVENPSGNRTFAATRVDGS
ncbi:tyrosine-type recombinase/integrase [Cribrihabitans pelagius]|uniref:tyrosine-type recombinase/integrase n=1 Tax=Cribrihabitans pelagius TaxID=1765746 RepID=UPI003B5BD79C